MANPFSTTWIIPSPDRMTFRPKDISELDLQIDFWARHPQDCCSRGRVMGFRTPRS